MHTIAYLSDGLGPKPLILTRGTPPDESWVGRNVEIRDHVWRVENVEREEPRPDRIPVAAEFRVRLSKKPVGPGRNIDC